jgi:hypothetical protein
MTKVHKVAFTPDSLHLISGDWNDIRFSDAATTKTCQSLAIAPNGSKLTTTSTDKTTWFSNMTTFEPIGKPFKHPDIVLCVAFSEDS